MKFYPSFNISDAVPADLSKPYHDKYSFPTFIISCARKWCVDNDITYNNLVASLLLPVLQGEILVEAKNKRDLQLINALPRLEKIVNPANASNTLYNLYNKHFIPVSRGVDTDYIFCFNTFIVENLK